MKMSRGLILMLLVFFFFQIRAQDVSGDIRMNVVHDFIDAYNEEDYRKAKKDFPFLFKLLVPKRTLERQFKSMRTELGIAQIDTVTYYNRYHYRAQLSFEKDTTVREFLSFLFNSKGVLSGVGTSEPSYIYPEIKNYGVSSQYLASRIRSIINDNHRSDTLDYFNGNVLVMDQGEVIFNESFGYADFDKQIPLNEHSRFDIASCSKQFTAMAIMILEEEGKLSVSEDLSKYIPELPYEGITIEDLLHHKSGLPSYQQLASKKWDKSQFLTNSDIVKLMQEYQPDPLFEAGKSFSYSNTGYAMLAIVVERVAGMDFGVFLDKHIFRPLGMNETRVYNTRRSKGEIIGNFANGYVRNLETNEFILPDSLDNYEYVRYMDGIVGDGAICSSSHDLAIWSNAMTNEKLVSSSAWERAMTKLTLDDGRQLGYGYGLFLIQEEGAEEVVYHSGSWPGYSIILLQLPKSGKTLAVLCNNSYSRVLNMVDDLIYNLFVLKSN